MLDDLIFSLKEDIFSWLAGRSEFNPDVFFNPDKHMVRLSTSKIVADNKVTRQGIEMYKQKILLGEKITPIIVVKHPRKNLYAVLDGHHRYYAYLELGKKEVDCALAGDYSSVVFYLTQHGYFQPSPQITEGLRHPVVRLHKNLKAFLNDFVNSLASE